MFLGNFTKKNRFLWQISEKFRLLTDDFTKNFTFFKANFQRISIFLGNFTKKFRFSEKKSPKFRFFQVISPKISIFRPFHQNFGFSKKICKTFLFFQAIK